MRSFMANWITFLMAVLTSVAAVPAWADGLTGVSPLWPESRTPTKITGIRYRFHVAEVNGGGILFGCNRLSPTGGGDWCEYLIEANLYDYCIYYDDFTCTTWPLIGNCVSGESSVRVATADIPNTGKVGVKTMSPQMFPRQTYLIDGITNAWKTDCISQTNLVGKDCEIEITRGPLVTNRAGWSCGGDLPEGLCRQWDARATIGTNEYRMCFALPESDARYFYSGEVFNFKTEWFHQPGSLSFYLWDMAFQVEGKSTWRPVLRWRVDQHDGSLDNFGVRRTEYGGHNVVEFATRDLGGYAPVGTVFYLGETPRITNAVFAGEWRQLSLLIPTNRFDAPNGFIVERLRNLASEAECIHSTAFLTNTVVFWTTNAAHEFFRCQFGLHAVDASIADSNLASRVRAAITHKTTPTNCLYDVDLNGITSLEAQGAGIHSLEGMQCLSEITSLNLCDNDITNLAPLTNLAHLSFLALHDNHVTDVSALSNLTSLTSLHLWNNGISDASPLGALTNLHALHLGWNDVTNLAFVASLLSLEYVALWDNGISNLAPFAGLTRLAEAYFLDNAIVDASPLAGLTNLTKLSLSGNQIADIGPLIANAAAGGLGASDEVWLSGNPLSATNQVSTLRDYGVTVHWP